MGKVSALEKFMAKAGKTIKSGTKKAGDAVLEAGKKNPGAAGLAAGGVAAASVGAGAAIGGAMNDSQQKKDRKEITDYFGDRAKGKSMDELYDMGSAETAKKGRKVWDRGSGRGKDGRFC